MQHGFCIQVLWQLLPPAALRVTWRERLALIHRTVTMQFDRPIVVFQVLYTSGICSKDTA